MTTARQRTGRAAVAGDVGHDVVGDHDIGTGHAGGDIDADRAERTRAGIADAADGVRRHGGVRGAGGQPDADIALVVDLVDVGDGVLRDRRCWLLPSQFQPVFCWQDSCHLVSDTQRCSQNSQQQGLFAQNSPADT